MESSVNIDIVEDDDNIISLHNNSQLSIMNNGESRRND